ncbi:phospholipase A2 inhibitor gamma subunit B-like [Rhinoderma darwinii]|uniref:phospholipase A2 inhibitor gamma subunit B-like n=1 Tax=Rhinoderma darwinii TaxID=43563 RepID=UPI003F670D92
MYYYCIYVCFSGYSLTCISCTSTSQVPCNGSAITCASTEDVCTSMYTETKMSTYKITTYIMVRGCGMSSECDKLKSLSNSLYTQDINIGCCKTDKCTPTAPIVSSHNTDKNGLTCPSCFTLTSSTCVPDNKIECTGKETRCTRYSIISATDPSKPIMAMAGCATESMCTNYDGTANTSITGEMKISIRCSKSTSTALSPAVLRPCACLGYEGDIVVTKDVLALTLQGQNKLLTKNSLVESSVGGNTFSHEDSIKCPG